VHDVEMRADADVTALVRLSRLIRRFRPDIVHMHTARAHALGVPAARLAGVGRRVVSRRVVFPIGHVSARLKYAFGVDRYIAISGAVADALAMANVAREKISIVRSGIETAPLEGADGGAARRSFGIEAGTPLVGCVAHFTREKALIDLVRAWPDVTVRAPTARLVLVGDGAERATLEREATAMGIEKAITFAGFREDVPDCIAAMDLFVLPSVMEGLSTSLLMAMALGKPVIATRAGGIPELVRPGETGILVPPNNPAALAEAIVDLLERCDLARRFSEGARRRVLDRYTADAMVEGTLAVYRLALQSR
jgi:glycosyltransferase involved in cell wall biosynthesis